MSIIFVSVLFHFEVIVVFSQFLFFVLVLLNQSFMAEQTTFESVVIE